MNLLRRNSKTLDEITWLTLIINSVDDMKNFRGEIVDGLRHLVTRVQQREGFPKRLSVVAALRREGVSYLAQALATTMAHDLHQQICLVDLNFWWPDEYLQTAGNKPSLYNVLEDGAKLKDALLRTNFKNLHVLRSGEIPPHKRPVLAKSKELVDLIDDLDSYYDHLILDIPAILATTESAALASLGDAACLVIQQGVTQNGEASQALDEIAHLEIIGSVLNKIRISTPKPIFNILSNW